MDKQHFDVIVIGGGVGGYIAAIRASQRGAKTALIEAKEMGGTCLNRGCIPSKALIADADILRKVKSCSQHGITVGDVSFDYEKMKLRKDKVVERLRNGVVGLMSSNKIISFRGVGKFLSQTEVKVIGEQEVVLEGKNIIIATGSEPRPLSKFPFDNKMIHDSTSFLNITKVPKQLVVIGGGVIGCEFASLHKELGADVTIIELLPNILSTEGKNIAETLTQFFKRKGIKIETNVQVKEIQKNDSEAKVILENGKEFNADAVLISVGRALNSENIGLEKAGIIVEKGAIVINEKMQTNVPHIYAVGDVTGKCLLAHVASHQGVVAAENATGHACSMDYRAIPSVIFTHPEIATVGYTLEKALEAGFDATLGKFPFLALGKSQAAIDTDGFAQVVISKSTKEILGAQIVGHEASSLISEMVVAIQNEIPIDAIAETIHAHPTLAEAWLEVACISLNEPLNFPPQSIR